MFYIHKKFVLDDKTKKVFDENGKALKITANSYRILLFLCENNYSNITDIGDYLDHEKDYNENQLRQYRHKINNIIGDDIIKYENKLYFIDGDIEQKENYKRKSEASEDIDTRINNKKIIFTKKPAIISILAMLITVFPWPYGYYTFMKFIVTGTAIYYAYYLYAMDKKTFWFWGFITIAVLFNPIAPIYLYSKVVWVVIDFFVGIFMFSFLLNKRLIFN